MVRSVYAQSSISAGGAVLRYSERGARSRRTRNCKQTSAFARCNKLSKLVDILWIQKLFTSVKGCNTESQKLIGQSERAL